MHTPTAPARTTRARRAALATPLALGLLAGSPAVLADSAYDLLARTHDTSGPRKVCHDFFCHDFTIVPPADVVDSRSGVLQFQPQTLTAASRIADAAASARIKTGNDGERALAGVGAAASMSSIFRSEARATLRTSLRVDVVLRPNDLLAQVLVQHCQITSNCPVQVDFMHQTVGQFSVQGAAGPGAAARYSESLRINSVTDPLSVDMVGSAAITAGAQPGAAATPSAQGDWSLDDFYTPQTDAGGTRWVFNRFTPIRDQRTSWTLLAQDDPRTEAYDPQTILRGSFEILLEQTAEAGFASSATYSTQTVGLAADFSNTSTFSLARVHDPSGLVDWSTVPVSVQFTDLPAVPEPAGWALLAGGLAVLAAQARRRRSG